MPQIHADVAAAVATARADLDRALERLQSLSDDDLQRFSYSVHALHNYLMVVSTTLELLRSKLAPADRDTRRWLDSLKQATHLMMSTARGVLTAAPNVVPTLVLETGSLVEIADTVSRGYSDLAKVKGVRIERRLPAERDRVLTDRVAAGAVIDNLLSNAIKYSAAGKTVTGTVVLPEHDVVCSVRDQGPGLDEADQARLFQRGVRLSPQPTGGETSTGFGLAIAYDLATALGGKLSCTSVVGQGSCFVFSLPLLPESAI